MNPQNLSGAAEAVLFVSGDPVPLEKIADAIETDPYTAEGILQDLQKQYEERQGGICLKHLGSCWQLCSSSEFAGAVEKGLELRRNVPLSQAAFEVLAVIAYNQPVTKAFVEQVRGVDCSGVISSLTQKELIEERGRLDLPGRPIIYGTTPVFLRCFCIESLDELPPLPGAEKQPEEDKDNHSENSGNSENSEKSENSESSENSEETSLA